METIKRPEQLDMDLSGEEKHFLRDLIGYNHGETGKNYAREEIWKRRLQKSSSPEETLNNLRGFLDATIPSRSTAEQPPLREIRKLITNE